MMKNLFGFKTHLLAWLLFRLFCKVAKSYY